MTRILSTLVPVVLSVAVLGALAGCTPAHTPGQHPTGGSPSTPSANVTGRAADTAVPQPALAVTCPGLASSSAISAAIGVDLRSADPIVSQESSGFIIPTADVLQTVGGITCEWSNGATFDGDGYVGLQLELLPHAGSEFARYAADFPAGVGLSCNTVAGGIINCSGNELLGTTWVQFYMFGVGSQARATALNASISSAVTAAAPVAGTWTPPRGTTTFGDCTQLLTPSEVATDLGVTDTTIVFADGYGGMNIEDAAGAKADDVGCLFQYSDEGNYVGHVAWLRGGAWAYDAAHAASDPNWGTWAPVAIAGLVAGDRAQLRCLDPGPDSEGEVGTICSYDFELGGNWLEVTIEPSMGDHSTADIRTATRAIATQLVAGYNAHAH
jgi:hypothetical protein